MKSLLPRLAWASAGLAVACGLASRATAQDSAPLPCPDPCPPARTVCAPTPKVIVEVPPPNVIIRAAAAPCDTGCKETLFQKICHFSCHPHHRPAGPVQYVQPAAPMQYVQQAPVQYVHAAPMQYVQPAPMQYVQPAPMQYVQPAPVQMVQAPVQYVQAAPVQMMQAPVQYVQAPTQFMQAAPMQFMVAAPGNFQGNADSKADSKADLKGGETCDAALKKVASQMETLTKVVEAHTQVLISHEERLQQLEKWARAVNTGNPNHVPPPPAANAAVNSNFPLYAPPAAKAPAPAGKE
ncbi:MAG: hypothetical protein U0804_06435 [Gemmataceae bacterium]